MSIDTFQAAYFSWCPVLTRCRPPRLAVHCRGGWASTGPDRTVGEPEERARAALAGPGASSRCVPSNSMVGKGLLVGDAALRPAHCPKFLPVTSGKCFVMLSTAYNRCGVFAGIGSILTGGDKMAIAWQPADEDVLKLRFSADYPIVLGVRRGGACLHVIQCIILLITYSITKYPGKFGHICTRVCGARLRHDSNDASVIYGACRLPRAEKGLSQQKVSTSTEVYGVQPKVYGH